MMGCSSSMSLQQSEKKPLEYSRKCKEPVQIRKDELEIDSNTKTQTCDPSINRTETKSGENVHISNTRILIISRDSREKDSTDTSSVVPIFNDQEPGKPMNLCNPCLTACSGLQSASPEKDSPSMSLRGGIKSVLKTGRNDPRNHMLANRPIKTVTFVESVTVVTVF